MGGDSASSADGNVPLMVAHLCQLESSFKAQDTPGLTLQHGPAPPLAAPPAPALPSVLVHHPNSAYRCSVSPFATKFSQEFSVLAVSNICPLKSL